MTEADDSGSNLLWVIEPSWQNFSSMYREAVCAQDAMSGMEISHHRTAALYFGIATIECFLNREMTRHQRGLNIEHEDINKLLAKSFLKQKIKSWPKEITGQDLCLRPATLDRILSLNDLRGNLTHLKNYWPETFKNLGEINPMDLVELVAEYVVAFHRAKNELFPYWVWGWNYLSPTRDGYQISLLPYTQFFHSLRSLGYEFEHRLPHQTAEREQEILADFDGYLKIASFLQSRTQCEPKWDVAPHQPTLCRKWWESTHQDSCGGVTREAIERALELDELRAREMRAKPRGSGKLPPVEEESSWMARAANRMIRWRKTE